MGLTLESLAAEMRPFHNDICIVHDVTLGRLVGVAEDDSDLYYMVAVLGKGIQYFTAVGWCVSLRGHYPHEAYDRLNTIFGYNNAGSSETFEMRRLLPSPARKLPPAEDGGPVA